MISNLTTYFATEITLIIGILSSLILSVFSPKGKKAVISISSCILVLIIALYFEYGNFTNYSYGGLFSNFWQKTFYSNLFSIILLASAGLISLLCFNTQARIFLINHYEEFPVLFLLSVLGMTLTINANDLLSLYLSLELQTFSLFILISIKRDSNYSVEAGLKYFVLSALASAIFLFGVSLFYGYVGTTSYLGISAWAENLKYTYVNGNLALINTAVIMIVLSFCFKLALAPLHFWAPDVYQGSSNLVTLFMVVLPKIAVIYAFAKLVGDVFVNIDFIKTHLIPTVAIISLLVGSLGGILQHNLKRMMAFSSIGHMGFMILCFVGEVINYNALMEYLSIYSIMNIGIFALIMQLRKKDENLLFITNLSKIIKNYPVYGILMSIFMLSMAGIPPFAGFFIKYNIFMHIIANEKYILAIFAIVSTVISAYYYLRIIKIMYFDQEVSKLKINFQPVTNMVVAVSVLVIVFFYFIFNIIR